MVFASMRARAVISFLMRAAGAFTANYALFNTRFLKKYLASRESVGGR